MVPQNQSARGHRSSHPESMRHEEHVTLISGQCTDTQCSIIKDYFAPACPAANPILSSAVEGQEKGTGEATELMMFAWRVRSFEPDNGPRCFWPAVAATVFVRDSGRTWTPGSFGLLSADTWNDECLRTSWEPAVLRTHTERVWATQ